VQLLEQFLEASDLINEVKKIEANRFRYTYVLGSIDFISLYDANPSKFFEMHTDTWCENKTEFFVLAIDQNKFHICDSKTKPDSKRPIENASIASFKYGDNSPESQRYMNLFKKENIDKGQCLKEIRAILGKRSHITVDEDLLRNLKDRRNKIVQLLEKRADKRELAEKIMDRCLFIRFLEDRADRNNLKEILSHKNKKIEDLIELFDFYTDRLNGDIFEKGDIPNNIDNKIMSELEYIFGRIYVHRDSQSTLVPYNFKKIPIILISNIYEAFLAEKTRRSEGIVFTPENIVDYTISKIFQEKRISAALDDGYLSALDPSCGSGIFLVKFFEYMVKQSKKIEKLTLEDKANIVTNCIYGIDKNSDALRIAALSLYLKIIEDETPENINQRLFGENEKHFMFPGLRKNGNLVNGDSLFQEIFHGRTFDIILGNPPWGYDFSEADKIRIKARWGTIISEFQSSQCFLLNLQKWMRKETVCGMVVNLSNFINSESKKFRQRFIDTNNLKTFVNLSRVKKITFGVQSEPACIVIFDHIPREEMEFVIPDLTTFAYLTQTISDDNKSEVSITRLKKEDNLWHIYSLGYDAYLELVEFLDGNSCKLSNFAQRFEEGLIEYSYKKSKMSEEEFHNKYRCSFPTSSMDFPIVDSLSNVRPYFGVKAELYLSYGEHLERARDLGLFTGPELIITRSWPVNAFLNNSITLYDSRFLIFKLRSDYPREYLLLFEAILNSKLAHFYLGVKYRQRIEGNYPKVNLTHLRSFPVPKLENKIEIVNTIIEKVKVIDSTLFPLDDLLDDIDNLVFKLYGLDYYALQQVNHYQELEENPEAIVTPEEIHLYFKEFSETFSPFLKENLFISAAYFISDFFGTMIRFTMSKNRQQTISKDDSLEPFIFLIKQKEVEKFDTTKIFKEEKRSFYDDEKLYIYKSNRVKDWTPFMAIQDANEEIGLFFQKAGGL
jgi:hypothetical protein